MPLTNARAMEIERWKSRLLALLALVFFLASLQPSIALAAHPKPQRGILMVVKQSGHCSAFTPADWTIGSNPQASAVDLVSGDRTMYAGWGGAAIDRGMQPYYGSFYGDPLTSIRTIIGLAARSNFSDASTPRFTSKSKPFLNYFQLNYFTTDNTSGLVFYKIYPVAWPQTYVESVYLAIAKKSLWAKNKGTAAGVAVSIRCHTQLVPEPTAEVARRNGKSERAGCGAGNLRGYNKELGTQYAHSPTTGQNFLFNPTTDWHETGLEGAGYYRQVGNSYEKLELGRDDDC